MYTILWHIICILHCVPTTQSPSIYHYILGPLHHSLNNPTNTSSSTYYHIALCVYEALFVSLSYLFINYFQFFIPHRSEIIWFLTCFVLFHFARLFSRFISGLCRHSWWLFSWSFLFAWVPASSPPWLYSCSPLSQWKPVRHAAIAQLLPRELSTSQGGPHLASSCCCP